MAALLVFVLLSALAALPGAVLFRPGDWYRRIDKPGWRPPDRAFGPVWAVLYLMIAVSGWLVWRDGGAAMLFPELTAFGVQLVLNALWSAVFFGAHRMGWALFEIVLLWLAIALTIIVFLPVSALAAGLLVPYLLWVSLAVALNFSVWRRNRA